MSNFNVKFNKFTHTPRRIPGYCVHRMTIIKKIEVDKLNWVTVQKCRKCDKKEQSRYTVHTNDNYRVSCITESIPTVNSARLILDPPSDDNRRHTGYDI